MHVHSVVDCNEWAEQHAFKLSAQQHSNHKCLPYCVQQCRFRCINLQKHQEQQQIACGGLWPDQQHCMNNSLWKGTHS
jgi:hypothetical protein